MLSLVTGSINAFCNRQKTGRGDHSSKKKNKGNTKDLKDPETTHVKAFQKDSTSS